MSAAFNIQLFVNYFTGCPVINVTGRSFDVQEYFLEDVLKMTKYTNKRMESFQTERKDADKQLATLYQWYDKIPAAGEESADGRQSSCSSVDPELSDLEERMCEITLEKDEVPSWLREEMDELLSKAWLTGEEEFFGQLIHLVMTEGVSVDHAHSETSATPLMIAAGRGFSRIVDQLLSLGANVSIRATNEWTALDWAKRFERSAIVDLLESYVSANDEANHDEEVLVSKTDSVSALDRELLNAYHHTFDDDKIDLDLLMILLTNIHTRQADGGVLIFLPGYDDIMGLKDRIQSDQSCFGDSQTYALFLLHSSIQTNDQKRVFRPVPCGVRKIILSTNIAESSITIDDVVHVIDSGRVKERSYDALTSITMLKCNWISKANVLQRKGRAGRCRPGICYHLFSRIRLEAMQEYQDPEILRYPLQELCLHTKLLAPVSCPIADFLAKAPDPPAFLLSRNAVSLLKQIDALDAWEDLTELGHHLTDLPVEPKYGKMILYSVVLKCLDPVLTIACTLAYKDPFTLPSQPSQKRAALLSRKKFAAGSCSDHMALLRAFQAWQRAKSDGWERQFCHKNYISGATMEMILGMRTQLLGQLRASGFVRARGGGDIRDLNTNSESWAVVKAALLAGHYPNVIRVDKPKRQFTTLRENKARAHASSVLSPSPGTPNDTHSKVIARLPTDWLIYDEMTRSQRLAHVKCNTVISPIALAIFAGPAKLPADAVKQPSSRMVFQDFNQGFPDSSDSEGEKEPDADKAALTIDDWISFQVESDALNLALNLRHKWHALFLRRMRSPAKPWSQVDEAVVRAVVSVIGNEELSLGLQQPAGIGQRPRPMSTDSSSPDQSRRGSFEARFQRQDSESSKAEENRYFVFRCTDAEVEKVLSTGSWATNRRVEVKLNKALEDGHVVNLLFSARGQFQCHGQMISPVPESERQDDQNTGANFPIKWIQRTSLGHCQLLNPWDEEREVAETRDGLEVEPSVGDTLVQLWSDAGSSDHGQGDAGEDKDITPTPGYARGFRQRWSPSAHHNRFPVDPNYQMATDYQYMRQRYGQPYSPQMNQMLQGQFYNSAMTRGHVMPGIRHQMSPRQPFPSAVMQRGSRSPHGRHNMRNSSPRSGHMHPMGGQSKQQ